MSVDLYSFSRVGSLEKAKVPGTVGARTTGILIGALLEM